ALCHDAVEGGDPVVDEAPDAEALARQRPPGGTDLVRHVRVVHQAAHVVRQAHWIRVGEAVLAVPDNGREFGGRQRHHGQADHHGLDDRKPQARVADRIEEEAIPRDEASQLEVADLADAAEAACVHSYQVERHAATDGLEDVEAEPATAAAHVVHYHHAARQPAVVAHIGRHEDAVLDDEGWRDAA